MGELALFFIGLIVGMMIVAITSANARSRRPSVPTVLGSTVPLAAHSIDFSRRYHVFTGSDRFGEGNREFRDVRVVGYVGKEQDAGGKFSQEWIVLVSADGRKFYISPHSIRVMEELPTDTPAA